MAQCEAICIAENEKKKKTVEMNNVLAETAEDHSSASWSSDHPPESGPTITPSPAGPPMEQQTKKERRPRGGSKTTETKLETVEEKDASPLAEELKEIFGTKDDLSDDVNNMTTPKLTSKVLGVRYDLDTNELFVKIGAKGQ